MDPVPPLELAAPLVSQAEGGNVGVHGTVPTSHVRSVGDFGGVIDLALSERRRDPWKGYVALPTLKPGPTGAAGCGLEVLDNAALGGCDALTGGVCPNERILILDAGELLPLL